MPAEWEKQKSTWIAWPHNRKDWPNKFNNIPHVFAKIISSISKVQIVTGQQTLLILFFFILPFVKETKINVILSGISYFKYTIGYFLKHVLLLTKNMIL